MEAEKQTEEAVEKSIEIEAETGGDTDFEEEEIYMLLECDDVEKINYFDLFNRENSEIDGKGEKIMNREIRLDLFDTEKAILYLDEEERIEGRLVNLSLSF